MRLWSIHPKYLDKAGLVACWREALLAQVVLEGKTKGYKNHPQLDRFKKCENPINMIGKYLLQIYFEGKARGYKFDDKKINSYIGELEYFPVTEGQLDFEFKHLQNKLWNRDKRQWHINAKDSERFSIDITVVQIESNSIFIVTQGKKESWEKGI
jgi:hypothetical protein